MTETPDFEPNYLWRISRSQPQGAAQEVNPGRHLRAAPEPPEEAQEPVQSIDRFFVAPPGGGRPSYSPERLAMEAIESMNLARLGNVLVAYEGGVFRDATDRFGEFAIHRLREQWREDRERGAYGYCLRAARKLGERPDGVWVNYENTMLNSLTGEMAKHDASFGSFIQLPVIWDPTATCELIDEFLADVLAEGFQQFAREMFGYFAVPWTALQALFVLLGPPEQGKSLIARLARGLIGEDNICSVSPHAMSDSKYAGAHMLGKLVNIEGDLSSRDLKDVSFLKSSTGEDLVRVERKYHDPATVRLFARNLFVANVFPQHNDSSGAIARRTKIVEVARQSDRPSDPQLGDKLTAPEQLSGLAVQAMSALYELRRRGRFTETADTRRAHAAFRYSTDAVTAFIDDECCLGPDEQIERPRLYLIYCKWADGAGKKPMSRQRLFEAIRDAHPSVVEKTIKGKRYIAGIGVRSLFEPPKRADS